MADAVLFSCEEGVAKPDERIYKFALERLGVKPEEAFMTGDNMNKDAIAPMKLGIRSFHLRRDEANSFVDALNKVMVVPGLMNVCSMVFHENSCEQVVQAKIRSNMDRQK